MRAFTASSYLLRYARLEIRLIYTGFLLLALVGMVTMAAFQFRQIGPTPERIASYYRGGARGGEMAFPKTFRELVEVTHFHSFIMGIVYLVLAHLFVATSLSPPAKLWLISVGFAGLAGDLVGPWLIRYVAADFSYLQLASWLGEWVGFSAFVLCPLHEMWFRYEREEFPPE
ncbi:MAG TPA: hypothetical protein VMW17_01460 [Candidatus Binatia bacterium]|nr:hypothetical protein [Candidatus Binatia bacterium]